MLLNKNNFAEINARVAFAMSIIVVWVKGTPIASHRSARSLRRATAAAQ